MLARGFRTEVRGETIHAKLKTTMKDSSWLWHIQCAKACKQKFWYLDKTSWADCDKDRCSYTGGLLTCFCPRKAKHFHHLQDIVFLKYRLVFVLLREHRRHPSRSLAWRFLSQKLHRHLWWRPFPLGQLRQKPYRQRQLQGSP